MPSHRESQRERAYSWDLFVGGDWTERFDRLVDEFAALPDEGRLLAVNCGTGGHVVALAAGRVKGEVVGTDADAERLAIARAKAAVAQCEACRFVETAPSRLDFPDASFDGVVVDATLESPDALTAIAAEALRVARPDAPVAVAIASSGSFDEFYSVLWEALHDAGLDAELWPAIEPLVRSRPTIPDAVARLRGAGMAHAAAHASKEEWRYASGRELLDAPLATVLFLEDVLALVPGSKRMALLGSLERVLDREAGGQYFAVSAKALVVTGRKHG